MIRNIFFALLLPCALVFAEQDPTSLIKGKDQELQSLLKKKARDNKETETIKHLINDIFNFESLARKALPSKTYKALTESDRTAFVKEFKRMVENSSVKKLEFYKADSTRYEAPVIKGDNAKVKAHVWNRGKESVLLYKMEMVKGEWKAWDLVMDDASTAENYKTQFTKILETKTFADLMEIIRKNADEGK